MSGSGRRGEGHDGEYGSEGGGDSVFAGDESADGGDGDWLAIRRSWRCVEWDTRLVRKNEREGNVGSGGWKEEETGVAEEKQRAQEGSVRNCASCTHSMGEK